MKSKKFRVKFIFVLIVTLNLVHGTPSTIAIEPNSTSNILYSSLPLKQDTETSRKKVKQAAILSQWLLEKLESERVKVGIISRVGSPLTVFFDKTGMTHSGFVFRDPKSNQWVVYSLYSDPDVGYKKSRLWQQSIQNFYYGQRGSNTDTLLLIPSDSLQKNLYERLTTVPFDSLLPNDQCYSLIAPLESPKSFNCTKWIVLQLYAAQEASNNTDHLIRLMNSDYLVKSFKANFFVRQVLKSKPDVNWQELSPPNYIHTVSVGSLLNSSFFERTFYYHDK